MSFLFCGGTAESPAAYLFQGLFPNLSRYLSGIPRYSTKQPTAFTCMEHSSHIVAQHACDLERPMPLRVGVAPSFESLGVVAESSSTEGSFGIPAQAASIHSYFLQREGGSSSATEKLSKPTQSRPDLSTDSEFEYRKRHNDHSLPALSLSHGRNVSASSNETLVWSPSHQSFSPAPMVSHFEQTTQEAAVKVVRGKQADRVYELEGLVERLREELADQTGRVAELETDLEICEKDRELNLNAALRLYQDPGTWALIERRNLIGQVDQLKVEILHRDAEIWSRDQLIDTLRLDAARYANEERWVLLRQSYFALQQQYGQMPQDFHRLERKYENLGDEHIDLSNRFKLLEGDHTELRTQYDQIRVERDQLNAAAETSKGSAQEAEARHWALEVQYDHMREQEAKFEKDVGAQEKFLADPAARMFKRTMSMARVLIDMEIDLMDTEQIALCQVAHEHLGISAEEIADSFVNVEPSEDNESSLHATQSETISSSVDVVEGVEMGSDLDNVGKSAILEGENNEIDESGDQGGREHGHHTSATFLNAASLPKDCEGCFERRTKIGSVVVSRTSASADENESSFRTSQQKQTVSAPRISVNASPATVLEPETRFTFDTFQAVPKLPIRAGSTMFQNLRSLPDAIGEGIIEFPSLSQEIFNPPQFEDFDFGNSNGAVPFLGSETKPSTLPEPIPEPVSPVIFKFPTTSFAQAPQNTFDPPQFEQDFLFGSKGKVSFTATQQTSSNPPAPVSDLRLANGSSLSSTSQLKNTAPAIITQANETATEQDISHKTPTNEHYRTEQTTPSLKPPEHEQKSKGKKANKNAEKKEKLKKQQQQQHMKVEGPNRAQRRAASRERKAAEKKANANAKAKGEDAARRGRKAVVKELMRG